MRILLVQTAFLGDLVLSTPVVDALRHLYPDAVIDLLTTRAGAELFADDSRFSSVIAFEKPGKSQPFGFLRGWRDRIGLVSLLSMADRLRATRYDRVYILHRSFRTAVLLFLSWIPHRIGFSDSPGSFTYTERRKRRGGPHAVHRFLSLVEREWDERGWRLSDLHQLPLTLCSALNSAEAEVFSRQRIVEAPYTVIVPGSAWRTKQWYWRNYRELAHKLRDRGRTVVLAGSTAEHDLCEKVRGGVDAIVNLAGRLSLSQFVRLVYEAEGIICNDSFALHVGSAARVPTVAIFCATSPSFGFGPWQNPRGRVVEKQGLWCKPCRRHGGDYCPTGTEHCMRGLSADEVLGHYLELLTGPANTFLEQLS